MNSWWHRLLCGAVLVLVGASLAGAAEKADKPQVGQPAPSFAAPATQIDKVLPGKKNTRTLRLEDLKGKNVVLFFFPKAMTRG